MVDRPELHNQISDQTSSQPTAAPQRPRIRGLSCIRTSASVQSRALRPAQIYTRILMLELQRERRQTEREQCLQRIQDAEAQLARIEHELSSLRELADQHTEGTSKSAVMVIEPSSSAKATPASPVGKRDIVRHRY